MLELLQFVFSSFWTFIGSMMLLGVVGKIMVALVAVILGHSNVNIG